MFPQDIKLCLLVPQNIWLGMLSCWLCNIFPCEGHIIVVTMLNVCHIFQTGLYTPVSDRLCSVNTSSICQ